MSGDRNLVLPGTVVIGQNFLFSKEPDDRYLIISLSKMFMFLFDSVRKIRVYFKLHNKNAQLKIDCQFQNCCGVQFCKKLLELYALGKVFVGYTASYMYSSQVRHPTHHFDSYVCNQTM